MTDRSRIVDLPAKPARFRQLSEWLAWQESLHVREIDLGLERSRSVAKRMGLGKPGRIVISVAGTNGKGSSVAMLDAILRAAGYRVGCYTSPHIIRYNERIRVNGEPVGDALLCAAFQAVDEAREDTSLTYFEFGTLAACHIFEHSDLDVAVLEVGLGGRLDAVNLQDADVALVSAVDIDHVDWLGPDRESIGREKAGIFRGGATAVCADPDAPRSLVRHAREIGAVLYRLGYDFSYEPGADCWSWRCRDSAYPRLPRPALHGDFQLQNAAGVLMALQAVAAQCPVPETAVARGLRAVRLVGRYQVIPGPVRYILDVAHNPQAASVLARALRAQPRGRKVYGLVAMLADKDCQGVLQELADLVDVWHVAGLEARRGARGERLAEALAGIPDAGPVFIHTTVAEAFRAIRDKVQPGDDVLVTGSFLTVAAVTNLMGEEQVRAVSAP